MFLSLFQLLLEDQVILLRILAILLVRFARDSSTRIALGPSKVRMEFSILRPLTTCVCIVGMRGSSMLLALGVLLVNSSNNKYSGTP